LQGGQKWDIDWLALKVISGPAVSHLVPVKQTRWRYEMGSLFKRGNVWWVKYHKNGRTFRESSRSEKKMVAKQLLSRREGEIADGKVPGVLYEKVTFDELADEFLMDYRINRKKSLDRAELSIKHLRNVFGGKKVVEITTPKIVDYTSQRLMWSCDNCGSKFEYNGKNLCPQCGEIDHINKGAANATINRELSALRRMFNLAIRQTPPKINRVPYIPMLKENNARKGFFEHDQFLALRDALPNYLKAFVTFAYKIGWRDQEISFLTWDQVDLKNGIVTLRVGETKNDEARTVYLDVDLKILFQNLWDKRELYNKKLPFVFPNEKGTGPILDFRGTWNMACRIIGLGYGYRINPQYVQKWEPKLSPGPTLHDFRRTAVRNMIRSGIPERVAMMISGHKTRSVFDRYNIVSDADLRRAAAQQQAYLEKQNALGTVLGTVDIMGVGRPSGSSVEPL
jgi:integrase